MGTDSDHSGTGAANSRTGTRSFASQLLAWLLVGVSFGRLGVDLVDAVSRSLPVSRAVALALVVVAAAGGSILVREFTPSIPASLAYFVLEQLAVVSFVLVGRGLGLVGSPLAPWEAVVVRSLAISLAVVVVFTAAGRRGRRWVRNRGVTLLKLPPQERSDDAS